MRDTRPAVDLETKCLLVDMPALTSIDTIFPIILELIIL
jgi:hypothetical protein